MTGPGQPPLARHDGRAATSAESVLRDDVLYDPALLPVLPPRPAPTRLSVDAFTGWVGAVTAFILTAGIVGASMALFGVGDGSPGRVHIAAILAVAAAAGRLAFLGLRRSIDGRPLPPGAVLLDLATLTDWDIQHAVRRSAWYASCILGATALSGLDAADARASIAHALRSIARLAVEMDTLRARITGLHEDMPAEQATRATQALAAAEDQIAARMDDLRATMTATLDYAAAVAQERRREQRTAETRDLDDRIDQLLALTEGERTVHAITPGTAVLREEAELRLGLLKDVPL